MTQVNKLIYLFWPALFLIPQAQAEWVDISPSVEISQSRQAFDRVNKVLFSYVTVTNNSAEAIVDPVRLVITNPSIPVLNAAGTTDAGDSYLQVAGNLAAGASTKVRVNYTLQRVHLSFGVILEQNIVKNEPIVIGKINYKPSEKIRFYIYDDDNAEDNSLAGLEVIIPAGALDGPERIIVSKVDGYINTPDRESISVSDVVKFEPAGLTFNKPVQLSIPFYGTANAEGIYVVRHSEDGTQDYIVPDYVDIENKLVYFRTEHFTEFQVKTKLLVGGYKDETKNELKKIVSDLGLEIGRCSESESTIAATCYAYWVKALNTFVDEDKTTVYDFYLKYKKSKKVSDFIGSNREIEAYKYIFGELSSINETLLAPVKAIKLMNDLSKTVSFAKSGLKTWIGASEDGLFNQLKSVSTKLVTKKINLDISSDQGIVNIIYKRADTDIFSVAAEAVSELSDTIINDQIQEYFSARNAGASYAYMLEEIVNSKDNRDVAIDFTVNDIDYKLYNGFFIKFSGDLNGRDGIAKKIDKDQLLAMLANIEALFILNKAFEEPDEKALVKTLLQQSVWEAYSAYTPWLNTKVEVKGLEKGLVSKTFEIYPGQKFEIKYIVEEKGYPDTFGGGGTIIMHNAGFIADTKETRTVSDDGKINTFVYTMTASDSFPVTQELDEFALCFKAFYQSKEINECKKIDVVFINKKRLTVELDESKIYLFKDEHDGKLNIILLPTVYSEGRAVDSSRYRCQVLMGSDVIFEREEVLPQYVLGYISNDKIAVLFSNLGYGYCGKLSEASLESYQEKDLTVFIKPYVDETKPKNLLAYEAVESAFSLDSAIARYLKREGSGEQFSITVKNNKGEILGENNPYISTPTGTKLYFSVISPDGEVDFRILETDLDGDGKFEQYKTDTEVARTYNQSGVYESIKIKIQTEVLGVFHEHIIVAKKIVVKGEDIVEPPENTPPELDIQFRFGQNAQAGDNVGLEAIAKDDDGITVITWAVQAGDIEVYCCNNENFFFVLPAEIPNQKITLKVTAEDFYGAVTTLEKIIVVGTNQAPMVGLPVDVIKAHDTDATITPTALSDPDGDITALVFLWSVKTTTGEVVFTSAEKVLNWRTPQLAIDTSSDFTVTLQVTDEQGLSAVDSMVITVEGETSPPIVFADENLKSCIQETLGLSQEEEPTVQELQGIDTLLCPDKSITDISDLSYLTSLQTLDLSNNQISDISVLDGLSELIEVQLEENPVLDCSAVEHLSNTGCVVQPPVNSTGKLNDTGITFGANYPDGNNSECPGTGTTISQQDCSHGRDATHNDDSDGHAGFSFTKLDVNGVSLPASASAWSCVRDNVTGLIWEKKTDDGGIHDKDNIYRWGGVTALGSGAIGDYYDDWDELVNGSNTESLCGYSDWRVPTLMELVSLNDYSPDMVINSDFFPAYNSDRRVWSSTPTANFAGYAWSTFLSGYAAEASRVGYMRVWLVRSGQ